MKYDYKQLRELSETELRKKIKSIFRRNTDEDADIRSIMDGKFDTHDHKISKFIHEIDCIKIGYYETWDDDEVYVILYEDRIEYTHQNKFYPLSSEILRTFK